MGVFGKGVTGCGTLIHLLLASLLVAFASFWLVKGNRSILRAGESDAKPIDSHYRYILAIAEAGVKHVYQKTVSVLFLLQKMNRHRMAVNSFVTSFA